MPLTDKVLVALLLEVERDLWRAGDESGNESEVKSARGSVGGSAEK